jgi:ribosome-associated protein
MVYSLNGADHIQLNQVLKLLGLVETGGEANFRITEGEVVVNSVQEFRKRMKLRSGDVIKFGKSEIRITD